MLSGSRFKRTTGAYLGTRIDIKRITSTRAIRGLIKNYQLYPFDFIPFSTARFYQNNQLVETLSSWTEYPSIIYDPHDLYYAGYNSTHFLLDSSIHLLVDISYGMMVVDEMGVIITCGSSNDWYPW